MTNICKTIIYILFILLLLCLISFELDNILNYKFKIKSNKYNFVFITCIINIFNCIYLIISFNYKNLKKINTYLIILLILNLILGIWNCIIYDNLKIYGRFNQIIIIELKLYFIKCILFMIFFIVYIFNIYYNNVYYNNDKAVILLDN